MMKAGTNAARILRFCEAPRSLGRVFPGLGDQSPPAHKRSPKPAEAPPRGAKAGEGGFTLIELLVAIAVITILTAFTIPAFTSFQKSQTLAQTTQRLKDDLRLIQNKALSAVAVEGEARAWGVHFTDGASTYYFFSCTPDSSRYDEYRRASSRCQDFASSRFEIPGMVIYTNGPAESDFAFEVLNGFVIRDGVLLGGDTTLQVGFADGSGSQTITIGQGGSIR